MDKIDIALAILRDDELLEKMAGPGPGVLGTLGNVLKSVDKAGQGASSYLASKGHKNLAAVARVAPHVAVAGGAKKAYDSETSQRLRNKYREYKIRKAMRTVQQGY
jgi:hypothetical protein